MQLILWDQIKYQLMMLKGSDKLYREGLEFTTEVNPDVLTQDMPKKQTKPTVEASLFTMAEDRNYF